MSPLRWILLILGVALVVGIYFYGRRRENTNNSARQEPAFGEQNPELDTTHSEPTEPDNASVDWEQDLMAIDTLIADGLQAEMADYKATTSHFDSAYSDTAPAAEHGASKPDASSAAISGDSASSMLLEDELLVLYLLSRGGKTFSGPQLYPALYNAGFKLLDNKTFNLQGEEGNYLAINALKPGIFPEQADGFETMAIALILRLTKVTAPLAAFDEMLIVARFLQEKLAARLCDAQRSSLTVQTIHYLQEEIQTYQHQHC